jgi:hypothetical protein
LFAQSWGHQLSRLTQTYKIPLNTESAAGHANITVKRCIFSPAAYPLALIFVANFPQNGEFRRAHTGAEAGISQVSAEISDKSLLDALNSQVYPGEGKVTRHQSTL